MVYFGVFVVFRCGLGVVGGKYGLCKFSSGFLSFSSLDFWLIIFFLDGGF